MSWANEVFKKMTLEEKAGQLIIDRGLNYLESMESLLSQGFMGGIGAVVLRSASSDDPDILFNYINKLLSISRIEPFLYIDAEKGTSDMFAGLGTHFPSLMALGAANDTNLSYSMGKAISKEARALGFDIVSNPVLDVNSNPRNPIVGTRAFGDNVDFVIKFATEYVRAMDEVGVIPTGKHFPGHGDTFLDSHIAMPVVDRDRKSLDELELKPFRVLMENGMKGIMTAHIYYSALQERDEPGTPATLSKSIMTSLVKEEFGYKGLIISDSLTMKSIKDRFGTEEGAILALKAGCDIILQDYNSDPQITFDAIVKAVKEDRLTVPELDEKVKKILEFKEWCGVHKRKKIDIGYARSVLGCEEHISLAQEIADRSVTTLENSSLPLRGSQKTLIIATTSDSGIDTAKDMAMIVGKNYHRFFESVRRYSPNVDLLLIGENPNSPEIRNAVEQSMHYDNVIYISFIRILSYKEGSGTMPASQIELLNAIKKSGVRVTTVIAGNPYAVSKIDQQENLILTYSDCIYTLDSCADIIFGRKKSKGMLPVTISSKYVFGYGL